MPPKNIRVMMCGTFGLKSQKNAHGMRNGTRVIPINNKGCQTNKSVATLDFWKNCWKILSPVLYLSRSNFNASQPLAQCHSSGGCHAIEAVAILKIKSFLNRWGKKSCKRQRWFVECQWSTVGIFEKPWFIKCLRYLTKKPPSKIFRFFGVVYRVR